LWNWASGNFYNAIGYDFMVVKEKKLNFKGLFLEEFYDPIFMSLFLPTLYLTKNSLLCFKSAAYKQT